MGLAAGVFLREAQSPALLMGRTFQGPVMPLATLYATVHHLEPTILLTLTGGEFPITGDLPTYSNINCMALRDLLVTGLCCYIMGFGCRNIPVASIKDRII